MSTKLKLSVAICGALLVVSGLVISGMLFYRAESLTAPIFISMITGAISTLYLALIIKLGVDVSGVVTGQKTAHSRNSQDYVDVNHMRGRGNAGYRS